MIRFCRSNRRGMTLLEVLITLGITTMLVVSVMSMLLMTVRRCETEMTQTGTDTDAVLAMQMMVNDIREAKKIEPMDDNTQIRIIKPIRALQGYYDRSAEDTNHPICYYISNYSHIPGRTGTWLWRSEVKSGYTEYRCIRKDLDPNGLVFDQPEPQEVGITLKIKSTVSHGASGLNRGEVNLERDGLCTELTDRVVYLRNY